MSIDIIPAGASAVVTDDKHYPDAVKWVELMEAIKDAQAADVLATKDAEADGVRTTKDTEANLERSLSASAQNIIQDVKDAESRILKDAGDKFINTIQDIKDAEFRLTKDSSDKFINTIQDIKEVEKEVVARSAHTSELVLKAEATLREDLCRNRELVQRAEVWVKDDGHRTRELLNSVAREGERTAYQNQLLVASAFKDQALLSERLAAKQELLSEKLAAQAAREADECCCELNREIAGVRDMFKQQEIDRLREQLTEQKLLGRRFRTFSPVPAGTLQATDED